MALKVVGAGLGRTGTNSLKLALERLLGAPCYHMFEVREHPEHVPIWHAAARGEQVDWDALLQGYSAAVDWPASAFWPQLSEKYPDAIIILSTRDAEGWWKSANSTIFPRILSRDGDEWHAMVMALLDTTFTTKLDDHDACIEAFKRHDAEVRRLAPANRLVVWEPGDGWEPLCKALNLPIPDEEYPKTNSTEEFRAKIAEFNTADAK